MNSFMLTTITGAEKYTLRLDLTQRDGRKVRTPR